MSLQAAETTVPVIMNGTKVEHDWDVCVFLCCCDYKIDKLLIKVVFLAFNPSIFHYFSTVWIRR